MTPSEDELVLIPKREYELLKSIASDVRDEVSQLKKALEAEKKLRIENEDDFSKHVMESRKPKPSMKAYLEQIKADFKRNNYYDRSWKSLVDQIRTKKDKKLTRQNANWIKKAMIASGDYEFRRDERDRRGFMIHYIGRK